MIVSLALFGGSVLPSAEAALVPPGAPSGASDATVQRALEEKILRQKLSEVGLTFVQIDERLARLSDAEVHQIASSPWGLLSGGALTNEEKILVFALTGAALLIAIIALAIAT